jgi:hypothetical protein
VLKPAAVTARDYSLARSIDEHFVGWTMQKLKRLRGRLWRAWNWFAWCASMAPGAVCSAEDCLAHARAAWESYDGRQSRTVLREPEEDPSATHLKGGWGAGLALQAPRPDYQWPLPADIGDQSG